jgi:hypothetical protein
MRTRGEIAAERAQSVALTYVLRWHLLHNRDLILELPQPARAGDGQRRLSKPAGILAAVMGLEPLKKGNGQQYAKILLDFMDKGSSPYLQEIRSYVEAEVLDNPRYMRDVPAYISLAIANAFPHRPVGPHVLQERVEALSAPRQVASTIEDPNDADLSFFYGVWYFIRRSHIGDRFVRGVMCVENGNSRPIFTMWFRTEDMTKQSIAPYVTHGSLIKLRGRHVKFFGQEAADPGKAAMDGYPVSIICRTMGLPPNGPIKGIVERRHEDGSVFSVEARFLRDLGTKVDKDGKFGFESSLIEKCGSWARKEAIDNIKVDIPSIAGWIDDLAHAIVLK